MNLTDIGKKLREVMGKEFPLAPYAYRRPATAEESKLWDTEGVVVNPASLDEVVHEATRRREETRREPASDAVAPSAAPMKSARSLTGSIITVSGSGSTK